jgi:hypothetical protein
MGKQESPAANDNSVNVAMMMTKRQQKRTIQKMVRSDFRTN